MKSVFLLLVFLNLLIGSSLYAGPREETFVYHEQNDNIKDIYKKGVFDTELPEKYQSEHQATFRVPYFLIPADSAELRQIEINEIPADIARHHVIVIKGKKYFKYLVHPAVLNYHVAKFENKFTLISEGQSEFLAAPTASERSLVLLEPSDIKYMVKLNLPLEINHRDRTMYPTEIKRGVWLTAVMRDIFARNQELEKRFFVFDESYGVYPKINGEALGGIVFREFPKDFYKEDKKVIPLFTLLALNKKTGKPLFFDYMKSGEAPWDWFEMSVLNPFLEIINKVTYKEAISLELHSQNVVVELDTKTNRLTGRFGYRDLGSTHLDFFTLYATNSSAPRLEMIQDVKRELGGAYATKTELQWLQYFFKKQISDLFFIQMASHGLITKGERDLYKQKAWSLVVENHKLHYLGDLATKGPLKTFEEVFDNVLAASNKVTMSCEKIFRIEHL